MAKFLIERNFSDQLELSKEAAAGVVRINDQQGVKWLFSYLSADKKKTYCLHEAPDAAAVRASAKQAGLPADVVVELSDVNPAMFG